MLYGQAGGKDGGRAGAGAGADGRAQYCTIYNINYKYLVKQIKHTCSINILISYKNVCCRIEFYSVGDSIHIVAITGATLGFGNCLPFKEGDIQLTHQFSSVSCAY